MSWTKEETKRGKSNFKKNKKRKVKREKKADENSKKGTEFEKFIEGLFKDIFNYLHLKCFETRKEQYEIGENPEGLEIKWDGRYSDTNNLYIEIGENRDGRKGRYVSSGIKRNDNSHHYIIGNEEKKIFIFSKKRLQNISKKYRQVNIDTSEGFLIPEKEALKY